MFHSARLKLTALYTLAVALIMASFSFVLYLAISTATLSATEVPESVTPAIEHSILEAQLARARLALLGVNVMGWAVVAAASYMVAGRTLSPIEAALDRQRQFTAHASHELRTPLTVMKGEIDVTRSRERSPEHYRQTLDRIDEEVVHLDAMASDLLALARMEGQGKLERQRRNVGQVVHEVLTPLRAGLQDRRIDLTVVVPEDLEASLDWSRIRHMLINLVDNATQHSAVGSEIRVGAGRIGKSVELTVFNSGSSIHADDLAHLFVPFYRGKGADSEHGTGLGLALCDWIARAHGGSIVARNVTNGVAFHVRLPTD